MVLGWPVGVLAEVPEVRCEVNAVTLFGPDAVCACCGGGRGHITIDHIRPRAIGGTSAFDNLQPLDWACNKTKSAVETEFVRLWRKAKTEGHRDRLVAELGRRWRAYCARESHGVRLICACTNCLNAPNRIGAAAEMAGRV